MVVSLRSPGRQMYWATLLDTRVKAFTDDIHEKYPNRVRGLKQANRGDCFSFAALLFATP